MDGERGFCVGQRADGGDRWAVVCGECCDGSVGGGQGRIEKSFVLSVDAQMLWCDIRGLSANGRFDANLELPGGLIVALWYQPPNTWHGDFVRHSVDVSAYAGQQVRLVFETYASPNCSAELYVDRIQITTLPSPATLVIFVLGGLCIASSRFSRR